LSEQIATPRIGRRERNKREKRERILAAAHKLFRKNGFAATTLQQIADLADVGFGTLYLYTKSKEDLLVQVFAVDMHAVIDESFAAARATRPLPAQFVRFFRPLLRYHNQDLRLARAMFRELGAINNVGLRHEVQTVVDSTYTKLATFVTMAQERGEVGSDFSAEEAARIVFAIYHDFLTAYLGEYVTGERFWEQLRRSFSLLMAGLATSQSRGSFKKRPTSALARSRSAKI